MLPVDEFGKFRSIEAIQASKHINLIRVRVYILLLSPYRNQSLQKGEA